MPEGFPSQLPDEHVAQQPAVEWAHYEPDVIVDADIVGAETPGTALIVRPAEVQTGIEGVIVSDTEHSATPLSQTTESTPGSSAPLRPEEAVAFKGILKAVNQRQPRATARVETTTGLTPEQQALADRARGVMKQVVEDPNISPVDRASLAVILESDARGDDAGIQDAGIVLLQIDRWRKKAAAAGEELTVEKANQRYQTLVETDERRPHSEQRNTHRRQRLFRALTGQGGHYGTPKWTF